MMKQISAIVLVLALLPSAAFAQSPEACEQVRKDPASYPILAKACVNVPKPTKPTKEQVAQAKRDAKLAKQQAKQSKSQQPKLMSAYGLTLVGMTTAIGGAALFAGTFPWPNDGEEYSITDYSNHYYDSWCTTSRNGGRDITFTDGGCGSYVPIDPKYRPVTYAIMGGGAAMMAIGIYKMKKVKVSPMIGPNVTGAKATVSW